MKLAEIRQIDTRPEHSRGHEVSDMHLVDRNAAGERAFCEADASDEELMGVDYYLEMRKDYFGVGTVCEACKVPAPRFAMELAQDLEAEGLLYEAEEYRDLAETLIRETRHGG